MAAPQVGQTLCSPRQRQREHASIWAIFAIKTIGQIHGTNNLPILSDIITPPCYFDFYFYYYYYYYYY